MKTADNDREYVEGQYEANLPRDLIEYLMLEIEWWAKHYSHALKIFEIEDSADDQEERL